jgi:hypothetical protein
MVTFTGYSSIECFGHGYIDRIFKCCMSWLHWQDIPVLNVSILEYPVNVTMTKTFHIGIPCQCNHDKNIQYWNILCFGHGYIDRVFQYWMFWSWLHWQDIQVLNVLFMVTLTLEYPVNVTMTYNTWISCQCNHDQNIQYWNIL